jgi:hypothetical protein
MLIIFLQKKSSIFKGNRRFPFEPSFFMTLFKKRVRFLSFAEDLRFPFEPSFFMTLNFIQKRVRFLSFAEHLRFLFNIFAKTI